MRRISEACPKVAVRVGAQGRLYVEWVQPLVKWVQDMVTSSGDVSPVGCKAEFTGFPKSYMPGADIEVGSASEFDCTYEVFIYKLTVDGTVIFEINRMTGVLKAWDGKKLVDYSQKFGKLL